MNDIMEKSYKNINYKKIDWVVTLLPFFFIITLAILFFLNPVISNKVLSKIRFFFGDTLGVFYLIIGLFVFLFSIYIAFSKYGNIVIGDSNEKPKYSFFTWGSMMFTCGLAADILFYSFSEWIMYASDPKIINVPNYKEMINVYPIFHWSIIPWGFYLVLAVCFGYMIYVKKRKRQKFSEACRPILGKNTEGIIGRIIDLLAVFALVAGTATTFSVATPLMSKIINDLFKLNLDSKIITIFIIILTCIIYTYSLMYGFKGISFLAKLCMILFFGLVSYVLFFCGQTKYIFESGLESIGIMIQNFFFLATYTDPQRITSFPQNWTIYYWAYWMVWCVAAPFFIGNISKGRTIKQIILGGYLFGVSSTILSFIVFGNYSLSLQNSGLYDFLFIYSKTGDIYNLIISIINTMPYHNIVLFIILITMICFYATSFDSIAFIASMYSYYDLSEGEKPSNIIQFMWCILLIIFPIALIFSESSMMNLQSVSIISAFPIGVIIILIIISFIKDVNK